jgi:hypothetical protein
LHRRGATCDASHNSDYYIEVVLTRTVPTFFMRLFGRSSLPVSARAVAGLGRSPYCLVSLATTKKEGTVDQTKDALKIEDDSDVDAPGAMCRSTPPSQAKRVRGR